MPDFGKLSVAALWGVAALAMGASAVRAQDSQPDANGPDSAQGLAVEGLRNLMQALELFVKSVPQYSAPEVLPNGDIIIRRIHPSPAAPAPKGALPDDTRT